MDPFDGVATFVRLVECGGFSAAAERMRLSKSAVSNQIARLEDRLGTRLLNRSTRNIALTEAGQIYFQYCVGLLEQIERAEQAAHHLQVNPCGNLRVTVPDTFGWMHLAPAICDFAQKYPEICLDFSLSAVHLNLVEEGFDVAIRIGQIDRNPNLIIRRLGVSRLHLYASPDYLALHGKPGLPDDLASHRCLLFKVPHCGGSWLLRRDDEVRDIKPAIAFMSDSAEVLKGMAVAGCGIARLPSWSTIEEVATGALVPVLSDWLCPESDIVAAYPGNRLIATKVRLFVDHVAQKLSNISAVSSRGRGEFNVQI